MENNLKKSPDTKSWIERQIPDEEIISRFFAIEKQQGTKAITIDFQFKNGDRLALPCPDLHKIEFDASKGITLFWTGETIQILGHHLEELYNHLIKHRVTAIIEDVEEDLADNDLVITQLIRDTESL